MTKNAHAVALGRKGGRARALLPPAELSRIGRLGGPPRRYRLDPEGRLEHRHGDRWLLLEPPYDRAAKEALRRLQGREVFRPEAEPARIATDSGR